MTSTSNQKETLELRFSGDYCESINIDNDVNRNDGDLGSSFIPQDRGSERGLSI